MEQKETNKTCALVCWGIAIIVGIILYFLLRPVMALLLALIPAVFATFVLAGLFRKMFCGTVESAAAPTSQARAEPATAAEPEPVATEETPAAQEPVEQPVEEPVEETPEEAPATDGSDGPEVLAAARDGNPDDLKKIKGVGPGLEKTLNELGFFHFDQIAAWTDTDVEWVDSRLKFKGRITRDDWIGQAKELAGS